MGVVKWDQDFEIGLAEVDKQHQHLVQVTNEFGKLLSSDEVDSGALEKVFQELVSYTQYHFEEEEKVMQSAGLDTRHSQSHQQAHGGFLEDVSQMHQELLAGRDTGKALFEFLMNWLVYHILGMDRSMGNQILQIEKGASAAEAFLSETRGADKATSLLLNSMNNLFQQVSQRNIMLRELNQNLEAKVEERTLDLSRANQLLGQLALTDTLTGLSNRRHAMQLLGKLWQEADSKEKPLACMMIDADGFKAINDNFGHDAGDIVLRELARNLKHGVRTDDIVCRLGGDEFLIICPHTDLKGSLTLATQMHRQIASLNVPVPGGAWKGSISVGVAAKTESMQKEEELIKVADQGVYAAKGAGKNCVKSVI